MHAPLLLRARRHRPERPDLSARCAQPQHLHRRLLNGRREAADGQAQQREQRLPPQNGMLQVLLRCWPAAQGTMGASLISCYNRARYLQTLDPVGRAGQLCK